MKNFDQWKQQKSSKLNLPLRTIYFKVWLVFYLLLFIITKDCLKSVYSDTIIFLSMLEILVQVQV